MSEKDGRGGKLLQRIADCLGIPIETFHNRTLSDCFSDVTECLRLWSQLRTDAGRAAALDALRKALDDEEISEAAATGELVP